MTCVQATASYSHLLGSCVTMLLSTCAYIITHTVTSSEMRKKRGVSGRETHEERTGQSVVTEKTRQEEEGSLSSSESQPNRTGFAVEREVEVQHEREQEEEEAAPETTVSNEAAVLRNGDITASTVSDSKPITKAKVL